jgi:ribosomal protein L11 methylase PrmA
MLDFGAGSGILGIAAALSGVRVEAVEIDELSQEDARTNATFNRVFDLIEFRKQLSEPPKTFDWVFANILNHVLLEFAEALAARVSRSGVLVLSGLTAADLPGILERYQSLLPTMIPTVSELGSWRAIRFSPAALTAS